MNPLLDRNCVDLRSTGHAWFSGKPERVKSSNTEIPSFAVALTGCRLTWTIDGVLQIVTNTHGVEHLDLWPAVLIGFTAADEQTSTLLRFDRWEKDVEIQVHNLGNGPISQRYDNAAVIYRVEANGIHRVTALWTPAFEYDSEGDNVRPLVLGAEDYSISQSRGSD
jgi:hypothetical protein